MDSTERTPEQGHIARTFSGNFSGQFNRLMRELAAAYIGGTDLASLGDRARLFALANTSAADSLICAWNSKKAFNFWRPHQAIRNGGADGNILTDEDTTWTSYMATPNYPDYTSGANNFGGSMTRALELFFGSDKPFDTPFRIYALGGAVPLSPLTLPTASTRSSRISRRRSSTRGSTSAFTSVSPTPRRAARDGASRTTRSRTSCSPSARTTSSVYPCRILRRRSFARSARRHMDTAVASTANSRDR